MKPTATSSLLSTTSCLCSAFQDEDQEISSLTESGVHAIERTIHQRNRDTNRQPRLASRRYALGGGAPASSSPQAVCRSCFSHLSLRLCHTRSPKFLLLFLRFLWSLRTSLERNTSGNVGRLSGCDVRGRGVERRARMRKKSIAGLAHLRSGLADESLIIGPS